MPVAFWLFFLASLKEEKKITYTIISLFFFVLVKEKNNNKNPQNEKNLFFVLTPFVQKCLKSIFLSFKITSRNFLFKLLLKCCILRNNKKNTICCSNVAQCWVLLEINNIKEK